MQIALGFLFILAWLTGNHPLESRGKHFKNIREDYMLYYERKKELKHQKLDARNSIKNYEEDRTI